MTEQFNKKDGSNKRSTFGVEYPKDDEIKEFKNTLDSKKELQSGTTYTSKKLSFVIIRANSLSCKFNICQFFVSIDHSNTVTKITFKNCEFTSCFFGSASFENVRFEECIFTKCDFSNTVFKNCFFDKCKYNRCSAYHPDFIDTEIDPETFLAAIIPLTENYSEFTNELRDEFIYDKYNLAKKIHSSNNSVDNYKFADRSLFELKRNQFKYSKIELKRYFKERKFARYFKERFRNVFVQINLFATNGGTSLLKLISISSCCILIFNLYFFQSNIADSDYTFTLSTNFIWKYFQWLPKTASIFLAYGYTAYTTEDGLDFFMVNICVLFGLFAYALVISVLTRKIYK